MCLICIMFEREQLSYNEAYRALKEQAIADPETKEHMSDAEDYIDFLEAKRQLTNG